MTSDDYDRLMARWALNSYTDEIVEYFPHVVSLKSDETNRFWFMPYVEYLDANFGPRLNGIVPFLDAKWEWFYDCIYFKNAEDAVMFKLGYTDDNL
jgi:hypothetical protein